MKRTNVYADPADLELIKAAAARRGVPEAEILREGIHLAALGARVWPEPLVSPEQTVDLGGSARRRQHRRCDHRSHCFRAHSARPHNGGEYFRLLPDDA